MIDPIDTSKIQDYINSLSNDRNREVQNIGEEVDASLQIEYSRLLAEAAETAKPQDKKAVQEAKELLASGELDTWENITAAASEILKHGI